LKQLLQNLRDGKTQVADVPVPSPSAGLALVRTSASLLSAGTERTLVEFAGKSLLGKARARPDLLRQAVEKARREGISSTLNASLNRLSEPMPLGYSSAGTIVELGAGVSEFKVGQRVACAGGGYAVHAEYALVPANLMAALPENVSDESAAFTTLGAIALHGFRLADVQLGARVAVIGMGLLGQLAASIASAAGCQVFGIDLNPDRVKLANQRNVKSVLREGAEKKALKFAGQQGFDAVLICADTDSNDPVELAGEIARDRANIVAIGAVGLDIPRRLYYAKELKLHVSRSYGPGRYDPGYEEAGLDYPIAYVRWTEGRNLSAFVDLLAGGAIELESLISHRFPIEDGRKAYDLISSNKNYLAVMLTYSQAKSKAAKRIDYKAIPRKLDNKKIQLGLIGAGNFARNTLLPSIKGLKSIQFIAIASSSGRSASDLAKKFGFSYAASEAEQVIKDKKINAVAVLTRHHLHSRQVLAALKAGKAVFCEKPLALTENELSSIEKQLQKKNSPLLIVGFNRRFAPLALDLKEFLDDKSSPFSAHYRINAGELPADHWLREPSQGGGRIIGELCHFVDFMTFLAGSPPNSVFTQSMPSEGGTESDSVVLQMAFPNGSISTISYLANGDRSLPKEQLEVFCAGSVALLDDFRSLILTQNGSSRQKKSAMDKGHKAIWQAFSEAALSGSAPPIPYDHLMAVSRATFAAHASLQSGNPEKIT
jgi:predicted dehydrogenase/threonine dehydrogenase-like Zn-dependent dehydrogenase